MIRWLLLALAVVACEAERPRPDAGPARGAIHPNGIQRLTSDEFHGRELERRGWDLNVCAKCHGEDFAGGTSNVTCNTCHVGGPTACVTCHGDGPTTGAHRVHQDAGGLACAECHAVPARWDAEGHVRRDGVADPEPAEVTFGARAALTLDPADREGPPAYTDGGCANVYCHGDALHAGGGLATRPRWDDPTPPGGCDQCHGQPPPSHAQDRCETCHPSEVHIDGVVQVGRTAGCDGCHGSAASSAPPVDLTGNVFTTALGVGAHQAHLLAPSRLRGPIDCATCHRVPAQLFDSGHLDSPPPAEVVAGLGWDRDAQTCADAACHGPARPSWTQTGGASCGTCHGVPPATASHTPGQPITSCATCHPRTIDPTGTILLTPGPTGLTSEHVDGDVDVF